MSAVVGRRDRTLLAGLAVAALVVFAKPIQHLLDLARDVEQSSGLALVPALLILVVVFVFHEQGKRQEAKAHAAAAEAEARAAETRAADMEHLVAFGQALGRSLDIEAIRDVVLQHLGKLAGTNEGWVMVRRGARWPLLVGPRVPREIDDARERVASLALGGDARGWSPDAILAEGHLCLPLIAAGNPVGVLGLPESAAPVDESGRRSLAAAAALLGIALRNAELFRDLRDNSLRDGLTGCFNRAHALESMEIELRRARRAQAPVSLILFDLDHFKAVNDRYGHLCGDAVLAAVGGRMQDALRVSDLKCRYGGEEFLVLLPETPIEGARRVADTLRREIADMPVAWKEETLMVTASFGVTTALPAEVDVESMIARADAALYRAKDQGRNCVRLSTEPTVA